MEEEIEMEIEDEGIPIYDVVEIDFEYEFDAARFFDFSRPETKAEALFSESWFNSAPDYPPSPFIAQLFPLNGLSSPHVSPKSNYADRLSMDGDDADIAQHKEYCDQDEACKENNHQGLLKKLYEGSFTECQIQPENFHTGPSGGLMFFDHLAHDTKKMKISSLAKPGLQKRSTLMKPTASQLAKQNQQRQHCGSRLQKNEGSSANSGIESQASKRQKLDGGQLRRGLNRLNADSTVETACRDVKMSRTVDAPKVAVHQVMHSFKARPLDRKILTSRGDIGVFRNSKRDVTIPKEFEFQKSKRTRHNLPTELFSKLALAGETQSKNCVQAELPQKTSIPAKGSKENRWETCHQSYQNMKYQAKEKQDNHVVKERLAVASGGIGGTSPRNGMNRLFGSWRH